MAAIEQDVFAANGDTKRKCAEDQDIQVDDDFQGTFGVRYAHCFWFFSDYFFFYRYFIERKICNKYVHYFSFLFLSYKEHPRRDPIPRPAISGPAADSLTHQ